MTEVDPEDAKPLIPLRRLLMLYTMARKNETNLIVLETPLVDGSGIYIQQLSL